MQKSFLHRLQVEKADDIQPLHFRPHFPDVEVQFLRPFPLQEMSWKSRLERMVQYLTEALGHDGAQTTL